MIFSWIIIAGMMIITWMIVVLMVIGWLDNH